MRIQGVEVRSIRNETVVTLPRKNMEDLEITVVAIPPTVVDDAEKELPTPQPKRKGPLKGRKGRVETDAAGYVIYEYDVDDPKYQADVQAMAQLQAIRLIVKGIKPGEFVFDAQLGADPRAYYDAIRKEMADFGFSIGDIVALGQAINEISGIADEEMRAATEDFFETDS